MTAAVPREHRRWATLALAAFSAGLLMLLVYGALDSPTHIYYYRVLDERTLAVGTVSGPGARVRVTDVAETPTTVTITVRSFLIRLGPGSTGGVSYESEAKLREPLGRRSVIDASSGQPVERANCPPPAVFAPVCP
jgi:hypothetical protein